MRTLASARQRAVVDCAMRDGDREKRIGSRGNLQVSSYGNRREKYSINASSEFLVRSLRFVYWLRSFDVTSTTPVSKIRLLNKEIDGGSFVYVSFIALGRYSLYHKSTQTFPS